ncbi:MAG TPA: hypothetical protein VNV38_07540 [Stellaceae bacterium]|jgi:hypothetical protein|nr:hypothetical protein [Stellaceae bacterium]
MKLLLCTLAAIVLVGAFTVHPADAACWWTYWGWRCGPGPYWHAYYGHPWGWGWHPYWHHGGYWHRW